MVPPIDGNHSLSIFISVTPFPGTIGGSSHIAVNEKAERITTTTTEEMNIKNLKCLSKYTSPFCLEETQLRLHFAYLQELSKNKAPVRGSLNSIRYLGGL